MIKFAYLNLNKYSMQKFPPMFTHIKEGMNKVSGKVYMKRLDICSTCEFKRGDRCGKCGCMLFPKAKWKTSSCPIKKW